MASSEPQDETDLLKSESFWRIAATAVFLQHLLLLRPEGPFENFEDLSFWLVQLLKSSGAEIAGQLEAHEVLLSAPADDLAALLNRNVWIRFFLFLSFFCLFSYFSWIWDELETF